MTPELKAEILEQLLSRFPELRDEDEPLEGSEAVSRLGEWIEELQSAS